MVRVPFEFPRESNRFIDRGNDRSVEFALEESHEQDIGQKHCQRIAERNLEHLSQAALRFSLQLDFEPLLIEIAKAAADMGRAQRAILYTHCDGQLVSRAAHPAACGPLGSKAPTHVETSARYLRPESIDWRDPTDTRNALCVPILGTQNRVLCVIELQNKLRGGLFLDQDVRSVQALARVASTAVDRAMMFSRIQEWTRSMETLLSFNATVNRHLEPSAMVRQLVQNVTGFLSADGGAAGLLFNTEETPHLEIDGIYFDGRWQDYERSCRANEGIPGVVLVTEFPFLVNDYQNHPLADRELARRFPIASCICVPIKNAEEQVLGFFKLHRTVGKPIFTWQEAAFLESLGNTAAVAIENARLVHSLARKNQQIKNLSEAHLKRLEEERQHIARELHDQTGQVLIGLKLRLQVLSGLLSHEQADIREELHLLRSQVNDAAVGMRDLAKRLRPPTLDELGFEATLRQMVAEYRSHVDFKISLEFEATADLSCDAQTALYRIAQESLTNIIKHARATNVHLHYHGNTTSCALTIQDDGCGFDPHHPTQGLGLIGIIERIKMLGGQVEIQSSPGNGTSIQVRISDGNRSDIDQTRDISG